MKQIPTLLLILPLLFLGTACAGPTKTTPEKPTPSAAAAPTKAPEYEPAYPADVSTEGLTEKDAQQQKPHSHDGGKPHVHDGEKHEKGADDHGHAH
jgi:hypothetical protein